MYTLSPPRGERPDRQGAPAYLVFDVLSGGRPVADAAIIGYRGQGAAFWLHPNGAARRTLRTGDQTLLLTAAKNVLASRQVKAYFGRRTA